MREGRLSGPRLGTCTCCGPPRRLTLPLSCYLLLPSLCSPLSTLGAAVLWAAHDSAGGDCGGAVAAAPQPRRLAALPQDRCAAGKAAGKARATGRASQFSRSRGDARMLC